MKVGLVLSGGVAKGAYQAGFLKAIKEDVGCNVTAVSSASIGLASGYAFAANKVDELIHMWKGVHFDSTVDLVYYAIFKHYVRDLINELVTKDDVLSVPVYAPVCYLPILHMNYCRIYGKFDKRWPSFVQSAMYFPGIAGGLRLFRGQIAIDGGMMDNIPVQPLVKNEDVDVILVLHFEAGYRPRKVLVDAGIPIIDYDITLHNMFRKHSFDFHNDTLSSMLESGYEYGKQICELLFNGGKNDLPELLVAAEKRKKEEQLLRMDNVTFETWVQRMNEVFYPFVRNKGRDVYEVRSKSKQKNKKQGRKEYVNEKMS